MADDLRRIAHELDDAQHEMELAWRRRTPLQRKRFHKDLTRLIAKAVVFGIWTTYDTMSKPRGAA